ncbi:MAG: hypothetical protein L6V35_04590 [Alistipes putredinis]|nr:MAG: hypothetical protein L6V35_04590 [Alistipes putredinis]
MGLTQRQAEQAGYKNQNRQVPVHGIRQGYGGRPERRVRKNSFFDEDSERLLGAHMVGMNVTEMIAEPTLAKKLGATAHILARTIHSHPTMNEAVMEAAEAATGAAIHL